MDGEDTKPKKSGLGRILLWLVLLGILAAAGYVAFRRLKSEPVARSDDAVEAAVRSLEQRSSTAPAFRLKGGVVPPTNKWFASLAFAEEPRPVFAYPLSMLPAKDGLEFDYPEVAASENVVFGSHRPSIKLRFEYDNFKVSSYDDLSVDLVFYASGEEVLRVKLTQGSPYVFLEAKSELPITISSTGTNRQVDSGYSIFEVGMRRFGVVSEKLEKDGTNYQTRLSKGSLLSVFAMTAGPSEQDFRKFAGNPIISTEVTASKEANTYKAHYRISSKNGEEHLFAAAPHTRIFGVEQVGSYQTILGTHKLFAGTEFTSEFKAASASPVTSLNLESLSTEEKDRIRAILKDEVSILKLTRTDTYFGGKEMYRTANLLELADALGMEEEKQKITNLLAETLETWLASKENQSEANRYFYYDPVLMGLVGEEAAFGSELFNDHHFHYSYFVYAAAVLAKYDTGFVATNRGMISAIVSDIASPRATNLFPKLRVFDMYAGHSWASGFSDFNDGNNQESSSEAIQAWASVYMWGVATKDQEMQDLGQWLYWQEIEAAKAYWFRVNNPLPAGYKHKFVSLLWGGKLDYSTFFSPRPQAKLGIQLIPMSPSMNYLKDTSSISGELLASVLPAEQDIYGQFGDYLIMYQAMFDKAKALRLFEQLEDTNIDDANSRSYTLAWILSQK